MNLLGLCKNLILGPIESIARKETENYLVSTVRTRDSWFAETAIASTEVNQGKWLVVETYDSLEAAEQGHESWIEFMEKNEFQELTDILLGKSFQKYDRI